MVSTKIASVAMRAVHDPRVNLSVILRTIDEAAAAGADLVVFPEQCLQGYLPSLTRYDLDHVAYQHEHAERVRDGPSVKAVERAARRLGVHVVFGLTERDEDRPEVLYNSAVLIGPDGLIGRYRKVHQPGDEKHIYHPGQDSTVFPTPLGRIGLLICYDACFPESARALALDGADLLVLPTAWALEGGAARPADDRMVEYYDLFTRARALENQTWFVGANLVGQLGDFHYPGFSRVVAPDGRVRADTGPHEGFTLAEVDIAGEIRHARSVGYLGYSFLKDYRPLPVRSDSTMTRR
ncbi:carbon-nitrogen hydrolase family protein [Saccharomonospora sp. NPDC046836]|uniref:carbon-nitrogen hydrolase family protein n=1 Tax=Saccharomonospora sp. NPDC046836 TaxID=3156921 RepID=UPI00340884CA